MREKACGSHHHLCVVVATREASTGQVVSYIRTGEVVSYISTGDVVTYISKGE